MDAVTDTLLDEETARARLGLLVQHFSELGPRALATLTLPIKTANLNKRSI